MNAPLPLPAIAPSAPVSPADAFGAKSSVSDNKGPSFSEVLAQQRPTQSNDARPTGNGSKEPAPGKTGGSPEGHAENAASGAIDEAVEKAAQAEAGAMAVAAAQQPVPQALLPQQALEIAAQAAEQVQNARGAAQAAITAASGTAAVLVNALNANEVTPTPRAPVPLTAQQAQAAAAREARDAELAVPVVTAAAKPGSQPAAVTADIKSIAPAAETPRLSADAALPRTAPRTAVEAAQASQAGTQQPARQEEESAPLPAATPTFQLPQHAAGVQDHLAQSLAVAAQRQQPLPVFNPAGIGQPPVALQVATPVGATHWGADLGQQLVVMSNSARHGVQTAELRLDPPDLGPLRVSLNLADGVASASFVSAHASVRQAIETALPQLQQALAQAGISLGQTSVGEQAAQQQFAQNQGGGTQRQGSGLTGGAGDVVADASRPASASPRNANALVDTFA